MFKLSNNNLLILLCSFTILVVFILLGLSLLHPSTLLAKSSTETGHSVTATDIIISKTEFRSGETVSGDLVVKNLDNKPANDWIYRASITKDTEMGPGDIINQVYYKDNISIPGSKTTKLDFSVPIIPGLPSGTYGLEVELLTASVANPGPFFYRRINVTGSGNDFIQVTKLALLANSVEEPPTVGLPHKSADKLKARLVLDNKTGADISFSPELNIYIRQSHNEVFKSVTISEQNIKANSQKVLDIDMPNLPEGNSYWAEAVLKSNGTQIAQIAPFRIVMSGTSAKIIKVTTDKTSYKKGDTVKVRIDYTGPVEEEPKEDLGKGNLSVQMTSSGKSIGSGETTVDLNRAGQAEVKFVTNQDFSGSEISVEITQNGKVLDKFTSKQKGEEKKSGLDKNLLILLSSLVAVSVVIVAFIFFRNSRKKIALMITFTVLFGVLSLLGVKTKQVFANHCFISCSNQQTDLSDRTSGHGTNPLRHEWNGPSHDSLWRPGQRPNFGGRMWQDGCGNTFGAPGYGLPNRVRFRLQYDTGAWNVRGGDLLGTVTDNSGTARSSVGWFWNGWSVPNNIAQKSALLQAEPEGFNLQGSPQHYDRLLLSERVLFGPAAPNSLSTSGKPGCSDTAFSQITFTWGELAPQITDAFYVEVSTTNNFSGPRASKSVGSCAFCTTTGSGGWTNLNGALIADPGTGNLALQPNTTYYWSVYAYNSNPGSGTRSSAATITPVTTCSGGSTNTLNVRSSGASNVVITGTGSFGGTTNYTRTSSSTISGTLTAPATSGGASFVSWSGCDSTSGRNCTVNVSGGSTQTVTANYGLVGGPQPDLIIQTGPVISPGSPYTVGQSLTFRGNVRNSGTVATGTGFFVRFCIDNGNCLTSTTGRVGADLVHATIAAATTAPQTSSSSWTATAGSHTIYMCADVRGVVPPGDVTESNETNNCASFGPFVINAPQPDLEVTSVSATPASLAIGTPMLITGVIGNNGVANATTSFQDSLVVTPPGSPNPLPNQTTGILNVGNTETEIWAFTPTVSGVHSFTICADVTNLVTESDETDNCRTANFSVSTALPWLKTVGGNVGSRTGISATWPTNACPGDTFYCNSTYMINAAGSVTTNTFKSAKGWLLTSYNPGLGKYNNYSKFFESFSQGACNRSGNTLPSTKGRFVYNSTVSWGSGTRFGGPSCPAFSSASLKDGAIVFINGNLNINPTSVPRTFIPPIPTVFIVNGNINIDNSVTVANGMFVTNRSFTTGNSNQQLTVNGSVAAALTSGSLSFGRTYNSVVGGRTQPAERILFDPKYLYLMTDFIGVSDSTYRETNP